MGAYPTGILGAFLIKPPIICDYGGDVIAFADMDDALVYVEVDDVEAGALIAFDGAGRLLTLGTEVVGRLGRRRVVIKEVEEPPGHGSELRDRLIKFMRRAGGLSPEDLEADLGTLVDRFAKWDMGLRKSQPGQRAKTPWAWLLKVWRR